MSLLRAFFLLLMISIANQGYAQKRSATDSLDNAGRMRPNDIVEENKQWNRASTDLFTYWMDSGLYGYYGAQPKILLDGIPVDINYFGWQNVNMVPLFVEDIEKSTSRFIPQVYENSLASAGLIDFRTAAVDTGLSFKSSFYIGNESGDPGPFIFDSLKTTPNIDRWGPDGSFSVAYRKANWYTKGLFSFRNHQQTDLISNQRIHITASVLGTNQQYENYKIQTIARSGLFETGYSAKNWNIKARALYGEDKNYLFLQAFGREIPTKNKYLQIALEGEYETGDWLFSNRYIGHDKRIGKRFPLHTYMFDWSQTSHTFSSSAKYRGANYSFKPGIIYERLRTEAPGIRQPYNDLATFFLDGRFTLSPFSDFTVHFNIDYDEDQAAESLRFGLPTSFVEEWKIIPELFYSEQLPLRQNSFPYWLSRGYTFADFLDISINQPLESFNNKLTGVKLTNRFFISDNFSLELEQKIIHHDALNIPWQVVEENEFLDTQPGQFTATREGGTRFEFRAQITNSISGMLRQQFHIQLQNTISGTARYKQYYRQIPETKISYQLDITPVPNLNLSLLASYRSSTEWLEYQALEGVEYKLPSGIPIRPFSGIFHTKTPSFTNVVVSAQKWFWDRRINTQFSVQNLLNQEVRTHTLGAELFTKFNIKLGVTF